MRLLQMYTTTIQFIGGNQPLPLFGKKINIIARNGPRRNILIRFVGFRGDIHILGISLVRLVSRIKNVIHVSSVLQRR